MALLKKNCIQLVIDVRSKPYSRFRHFNREPLQERLSNQGIEYLYLGEELGGHPVKDEYYNSGGRVMYERLASSRKFRNGISKVVDESERCVCAVLCAEEDPADCHRHPLLATMLLERGAKVLHIRRDGSVQDAAKMGKSDSRQLAMFEPVGEDFEWQSPKRIRPKGQG